MDVLPESQQQQQMVQQMLGVFEALMGYTMSSWTPDTSAEKAQKLNNLFKGYTRVAEFAKVIHRVLKYGLPVSRVCGTPLWAQKLSSQHMS
jgi:hypothetical protein